LEFGINTNQKEFKKEEIKEIASSIQKEFHIMVDRQKVIAAFCNSFEEKLEKRRYFRKLNNGDLILERKIKK